MPWAPKPERKPGLLAVKAARGRARRASASASDPPARRGENRVARLGGYGGGEGAGHTQG